MIGSELQLERRLWIGLSLLAVIAHLVNLHLPPLMADEGVRALVSREMILSGNYWAPTNYGEFYYKKPPLYNWILAGFFLLFDSGSEFIFRLPSILSFFIFIYVIWLLAKPYVGSRVAFLAAFGFMLSGRLLTRDSMLGHIDITYSLVTYIGFFTVFHFQKTRQYWVLFLLSYSMAACGTLMKGLPSIPFQGLTLLAWFAFKRDWKHFFSIQHLAGIFLYLSLVGGYFYMYSEYNDPINYYYGLYDQAEMRTVIAKRWYQGVLNLFMFPIENLGHLFPTSLMLVFALSKGTIRRWLANDYFAFVLVTLLVNLIPYWLSPGYYPRYLFMLYPLFFILIANELVLNYDATTWKRRLFEGVFLFGAIAMIPLFIVAAFLEELRNLWYFWPAIFIVYALIAGGLWLWHKQPQQRPYYVLLFLLVFRLGFDFFVIPYRLLVEKDEWRYRRECADAIVAASGDKQIAYYANPVTHLEQTYYVETAKNIILKRDPAHDPQKLMLVWEKSIQQDRIDSVLLRYDMHFEGNQVLLVKLRDE